MAGRVLLARQISGYTAVQAYAQINQVLADYLCLSLAQRRQHVVVVCAEGGLAMSYQVDAAHVRYAPVR